MRKFIWGFIILMMVLGVAIGCTDKKDSEPSNSKADTTMVVDSKKSVYDRLLEELDSTEIYNDSILYGYWFMPHAASFVNIFFHKNNTFEYHYVSSTPDNKDTKDQFRKGQFVLKGDTIFLYNTTGTDDKNFDSIMFYKHNDVNFYIEDRDDLFLIKGSD